MKAPDKIYMTTLSANKVYGNNWGCWTDRECPGETYIRKEALLEWLEQNRNQSQMWFDRYKDKEDLSAKQVRE